MTLRRFLQPLRYCAAVWLAFCVFCPALLAQGPLPDAPMPSVAAALPVVTSPMPSVAAAPPIVAPVSETRRHKFWDRENSTLFAVSAGLSGADFAVTRANLQNGGRELNPMARVFGRSTPGLAANFGLETAGVIGVSYFFHKTGHHKLERIVSVANISASAGAVSYGWANR